MRSDYLCCPIAGSTGYNHLGTADNLRMLLINGGQEIEGDIGNLLIADRAVAAFFQRTNGLCSISQQLAVFCHQFIIDGVYNGFVKTDTVNGGD